MPNRLLELIHKYPYNQGLPSPTTDLSLLPHPPFTTRLYDALFVRIEIELPYGKRKPSSKLHPLSLLSDAFSTKVEGEYADLWSKIATASKNGDSSLLTNIFTDDTITYLSFVPDESSGHEVKTPTFDLASSSVSPHKASFSVDDADKSAAFVPDHPKLATEPPLSPLQVGNGIGSDWAQFSASGFLEVNPSTIPLASTLFDTDIEKTTPPEAVTPLSRKSSKRSKAASPSSPRKSFDLHRPTSPETKLEGVEEQQNNIVKASQPRIIQLDEAFIDFWSDSLLDPISADWPTFIICKFKSSLVPELTFEVAQEAQKQKTIQWLLLEQVYTIRSPPVAPIVVRARPRSPISPSPSLKQRFSFWSVSRTASTSSATSQKGKKKDQEVRVGEMGELVEEEPKTEGKEVTARAKSPIFRPRRSLDITAPKSAEAKKKTVVVKPAEEAKIDEETSGGVTAAGVATGIVVASAAVVITNGLPTAQPNIVEAVTTTKAKEDHSVDVPAIEAVESTRSVVTETVPEPTVKQDGIPVSTSVSPDVVSSLEATEVETEQPLVSDNVVVEKPAVEPEVIVGEEREIESSPATQDAVRPDVVSSLEAKVETEALESDTLVVEKTAVEPGVIVGEEREIESSPATQAAVGPDVVSSVEVKVETEALESDTLVVENPAVEPVVIVGEEREIESSPATQAAVGPDVVSSVEVKVETEALESDNLVIEKPAVEPEVIVGEEREIESSPATQAAVVPDVVSSLEAKVETEALESDTLVVEEPAVESGVIVGEEREIESSPATQAAVGPDVVSSVEVKVETEALESDNLVVEKPAVEPGMIVGEEMEGQIEIESSPATQAVVGPSSVSDVAPTATEAITEVGETVGVFEQVSCRSLFL